MAQLREENAPPLTDGNRIHTSGHILQPKTDMPEGYGMHPVWTSWIQHGVERCKGMDTAQMNMAILLWKVEAFGSATIILYIIYRDIYPYKYIKI